MDIALRWRCRSSTAGKASVRSLRRPWPNALACSTRPHAGRVPAGAASDSRAVSNQISMAQTRPSVRT